MIPESDGTHHSTQEAGASILLCLVLRQAYSMWQVLGQPRLHSETLSQQTNSETNQPNKQTEGNINLWDFFHCITTVYRKFSGLQEC